MKGFSWLKKFNTQKTGSMLVLVLIFGYLSMTIIVGGITSYALFEHRASNQRHSSDAALHIAEAGISYYRWHLAHSPDDYWDGNPVETEGPFEHGYQDKHGNIIGTFSLEITPPLAGSTVVTIQSTGWSLAHPNTRRTIKVRTGRASLANYTFIQNSNMSFSPTTFVQGAVHSNGGIEFNGNTNAFVQSSKETYTSPYDGEKNGVWGDGGPQELWRFPVPEIDFDSVSADLSALKALGEEAEGFHRNSSGVQGYHVVFLADGTFDLYQVTSRVPYCQWWGPCQQQRYDIGGQQLLGNYAIPENGAMFFDDHVWVEGEVNGRVTIGAGRFPENSNSYREMYISGNITYTDNSTDNVLGLIAQGDIIVPLNVPNKMTIEAAALSQHGSIHRPLYRSSYTNSLQDELTFFGSQISFEGGGWKWGTPPVSGFTVTNHIYDGNLLYSPPPGFPTGETYDLISWEEVL